MEMKNWNDYLRDFPKLVEFWEQVPEPLRTLLRTQIDHHARERAIAFFEWCEQNEPNYNIREEHTHTADELYDHFREDTRSRISQEDLLQCFILIEDGRKVLAADTYRSLTGSDKIGSAMRELIALHKAFNPKYYDL